MKPDDPLDASLSRLPVPPASPTARDRALHRATIALRQSAAGGYDPASAPGLSSHEHGRLFAGGLRFAAGFAMLAALAAATILCRLEKPRQMREMRAGTAPSTPVDQVNQVMLGQIEALFGPQLNAVVEYAGKAPEIRLSEDAEAVAAGQSQPIVIEFKRGVETVRVLGFSGRTVSMELGGRQTRFEPLASGDGQVILSGESFCWTPQDRGAELHGYQISARLLSRS